MIKNQASTKLRMAAFALALASSPATVFAQASGIEGLWIDHTGRGAVEIKACGANGRMCGYLVWLQEPNFKDGRPLTDGNNPSPGLRKRPICGLPIITNMARLGDGSYDNGKIYDPEKGETFDVAAKLLAKDQLQITGYLGVKFLSETFKWRRATTALARCDGPKAI